MGSQAYIKRHKEMGLCQSCSRKASFGITYCAIHAHSHSLSSRKWSELNPGKEAIQSRLRYSRRLKEGKCVRCGAPLMKEETGVTCVNCSTRYGRWRV